MCRNLHIDIVTEAVRLPLLFIESVGFILHVQYSCNKDLNLSEGATVDSLEDVVYCYNITEHMRDD